MRGRGGPCPSVPVLGLSLTQRFRPRRHSFHSSTPTTLLPKISSAERNTVKCWSILWLLFVITSPNPRHSRVAHEGNFFAVSLKEKTKAKESEKNKKKRERKRGREVCSSGWHLGYRYFRFLLDSIFQSFLIGNCFFFIKPQDVWRIEDTPSGGLFIFIAVADAPEVFLRLFTIIFALDNTRVLRRFVNRRSVDSVSPGLIRAWKPKIRSPPYFCTFLRSSRKTIRKFEKCMCQTISRYMYVYVYT